jgi:glycosyltransferase involved in cell wall biosynthesis
MKSHLLNDTLISVVIPCKNEEKHISRCLNALLRQRGENPPMDIVVVDNGSTDASLEILEGYKNNITLLSLPNASISALRNLGANESQGEWIAFIDADVEVHEDWYAAAVSTLRKLEDRGLDTANVVTGSTYAVPDNGTWIERIWYNQLMARDRERNDYINGGNLIVHRTLFNKVGGFDPRYRTGEDVKFCRDAKAHGGSVVKDPSLLAFHHGYPKTIGQFFRRERWHGLGMARSLAKPWDSRDLSLAYFYSALLPAFLVCLILSKGVFMCPAILLLLMFGPLFFPALKRSGAPLADTLLLTLLYFVYGWAKVFSLLDIILQSSVRKPPRPSYDHSEDGR